jgi:ribosomal-protein-alanine N-acetyltransferase
MSEARPLVLRPMIAADIAAVVALDRIAFATPWSASAFRHEVSRSRYSHMLILERERAGPSERESGRGRPWWSRRRGGAGPGGYGGLWVIEDEGHISTLAVQPGERGQRWGELLLTALMQRALVAGAGYIVLEVRVSNQIAQALYRKYDFAIGERRPRYYADGEDAYSMRLEPDAPALTRFQERRAALWGYFAERGGLQDRYTGAPWPEASTSSPRP